MSNGSGIEQMTDIAYTTFDKFGIVIGMFIIIAMLTKGRTVKALFSPHFWGAFVIGYLLMGYFK